MDVLCIIIGAYYVNTKTMHYRRNIDYKCSRVTVVSRLFNFGRLFETKYSRFSSNLLIYMCLH